MRVRNVKLTSDQNESIEKQVSWGEYCDANEVLQAGLRLLEQQTREGREKLSLLRSVSS